MDNVIYKADVQFSKQRKERERICKKKMRSVSFKALPTDRRIKQYINAHM